MYSGPVIDLHAHIAFTEDQLMGPRHRLGAAGLVEAVRLDTIVHAAAIVIAHGGNLAGTTGVNDQVLATSTETDGFLIPVISVHPADGTAALDELDRVASAGARILKLHPNSQQFDVADPAVATVVGRAGELGLVVLFDGYNPFDGNQVGKFVHLAMDCPQTRMILAHMNGPGFAELLAFTVAAKYPEWPGNVYHDLSAVAEMFAGSPYAGHLAWTVRQLGVDRVLYGSDWPLCDPSAALAAVRSLGFTDEEERQIYHGTAAQLLGL